MQIPQTENLLLQIQALQKRLEECVRDRTSELMEVNEMLRREIDERLRVERRLTETKNELLQASKISTLSKISENITHELNQPLAALRGFSENARVLMERGRYDEANESLQSIDKMIDRLAKITSQLRNLGRRQKPALAPASVKVAINDALVALHQRITNENIQTIVNLAIDHNVLVDLSRLEQVLVSIFANALDAMAESPRRELIISAVDLPPRVRISVRDTGHGIAAHVLSRLFEPFLTTKSNDQAFGLGLATSYSLVKEFGGELTANNHPEGGAEFIIELFGVAAP